MIQEAVIVMTLLGCGDGTTNCDYISSSKQRWSSHAECTAAIPAQLRKLGSAPYPVVTASCDEEKTLSASPVARPPSEPETETSYSASMFDLLRAQSENTEVNLVRVVKRSLQTAPKWPDLSVSKLQRLLPKWSQ